MSIIGKRVRHIEHGGTGKVAVGGHTAEEIMVIWDDDGGASAWPPEALEWVEEDEGINIPERAGR